MEKVIYSDTLNQNEYLRLLAINDIPSFGLRILDTYELASLILLKANISLEGRYIDNKETDFIFAYLLNDISFLDSKNIKEAIISFLDTGKGNKPEELEPFLDQKYVKKREVILDAFNKYIRYKLDNHLYDLYDILYLLDKSNIHLDISITYFDDIPSSLFAYSVFNKICHIEVKQYPKLFNENNIDITKCYGKDNEISYVFNKIHNDHLSLDKCLIVLINNNDLPILIDNLEKYHLPYTSSIGYPFFRSNVGRLIKMIIDMREGLYGVDVYRELFSSPYFKKEKYLLGVEQEELIKYAGWLRIGNGDTHIYPHLYKKEIYDNLQLLNETFSKDLYEFILDNVIEDEYHLEAMSLLQRYDSLCKQYHIDIFDIIDIILNSNIHQHISSEGKIHIANLSEAFSSIREDTFIIGLDSSFPGQAKENYLIYDEEYLAMNAANYVSSSLIKEKERLLKLFIERCRNVHLSYPYYDNVGLKDINPSSLIAKIGTNKSINEFTYTDNKLSKNAYLIDRYNAGENSVINLEHIPQNYLASKLLEAEYSPSKFESFFNNKIKFVLENIFNFSLPDKDDPYVVIAPNDKGDMFHKLVEGFDKKTTKKDDFIQKGLQMFDNFLLIKPPLIEEASKKERENFIKTLDTFYEDEPGNICLFYEKPLKHININGISFKGKFDRLEQNALGEYILVDYKTGSKVKHVDNDIDTCLQGVIYMKMIELGLDIKVNRCEFRYPFASNAVVTIQNTPEVMAQLDDKIELFKQAILNGEFTSNEEASYIDQYQHLFSLMKGLKK